MDIPEDTLHDILNTVPAVLYEYVLYEDGSSEFLYLSPTSPQILGHPAHYFIEDMNHFWEMVLPEDLKRLQGENVSANIANVFFVSEVRFALPSGEQRWIRCSSKPTSKKKKNAVIWCGYIIDITSQKNAEAELKKLQGIIPICMHCKGIRDDKGYWNRLEKYISEHSGAKFSHGICEKCLKEYYQEEAD